MTPDAGTYQVSKVHDGREVSPFEDYIETCEDRPYAEFNCPTCKYSVTLDQIVKEGGGTCEGCGRRVQLHITTHNQFGEWRNIPEEQQEAYR